MAEYYVGRISTSGSRRPSFTQQPVGPINFTIGTSATVFVPFVVSDSNPQDAIAFSVTGALPSTVTAFFVQPTIQDAFTSGIGLLRIDYFGGGTAASANIQIIADDGTGE
jgi:hypothetical protein